jgi:aspartate 1-decarboxylase
MENPSLCSILLDDFGATPISSSVFMRESLTGYDVFVTAEQYIDPPIKVGSFSNGINWKNFAEILKTLEEGYACGASIDYMHVTGISGLRAECLKYAWAYQDDSEDDYKELLDFLLSLEEKTIDYLEENFDLVKGGKDFFSFIEFKKYILKDNIRDFLFVVNDMKYELEAASISKLLDVGSIENEEKLKLKDNNDEKRLSIYSVEIEKISSKYNAFKARNAFAPPSDQTLVRNYLKKYVLENGKMPIGQHRVEIYHLGKVYGPGVIDFGC